MFFRTCFFMALSLCCWGVLGIAEPVFTQPWRRRLCGGVRAVPVAGGAGRDPEMASPSSSSSSNLGKKPPLVSAQAPGRVCRRVCPLARGCASKPCSAQGCVAPSRRTRRVFASPSSSPVASPLPSHPAFPGASRMVPSSFIRAPSASSAGFGAFRGREFRGISQ